MLHLSDRPHHAETSSVFLPETLASTQIRHIPVHPSAGVILGTVNVVLSLVAIAVSFLGNERYADNHYREDSATDAARVAVGVISLLQVAFLCTPCLAARQRGKLAKSACECVAHLLVLPPRVNYESSFSLLGRSVVMSMSDICVLAAFVRLYHVGVLARDASRFAGSRARTHCQIQGVKSRWWVLRAALNSSTIFPLLFLWLIIAFIAGVCLHVLEHSLSEWPQTDLWNSVWCVFDAQAGIGYGDILPHTHLGRGLVSIDVFAGLMVLSLVISKVKDQTALSKRQKSLFRFIGYEESKRTRLKALAVVLLQRWWRLLRARQLRLQRLELVGRLSRCCIHFKFDRKREEALLDATLQDEVAQFERQLAEKLRRTSLFLRELVSAEKSAYSCLNRELMLFEKAKRTIKVYSKSLPASISSPHFSLDTRTSRSISSRSSICKLRQQQAAQNAVKRLNRKRGLLYIRFVKPD